MQAIVGLIGGVVTSIPITGPYGLAFYFDKDEIRQVLQIPQTEEVNTNSSRKRCQESEADSSTVATLELEHEEH